LINRRSTATRRRLRAQGAQGKEAGEGARGRAPVYACVGGVLYADTRAAPDAEFAREKLAAFAPPGRAGQLRVESAERTPLRALALAPGRLELFVHAGDCEHLLVCTGLRRAAAPERARGRRAFPLVVARVRPLTRRCDACDRVTAKWVTYNDPMAARAPGLFCSDCYDKAHYKPVEQGYEQVFPDALWSADDLRDNFECFRYHHDAS
jgi:hypothetical protein